MWNYGAKFFDAWQVSRVAVVNDGKDLHLSLKCHLPFNVAVEKTNFMNVSILCMTTECSIAMFASRKNRAATCNLCIFLHENDPGYLVGFQFTHCTNGESYFLYFLLTVVSSFATTIYDFTSLLGISF